MSEETTNTEGKQPDSEVQPPEIKPQPDTAVSPDTEGVPPAEAKTPDSEPSEHMIPKSRFDEVLAQQKELKAQLQAIQAEKDEAAKAQEKAEQAALEQEGKWKELFEKEQEKREKLEAKAKSAADEAKAAQLAMLRLKVATTLEGFPRNLADRLQGETEEELMADAKAILEDLPHVAPVKTETDASTGTNGAAPKPIKTDLEIQEEAARTGVSFEHLKQHYEELQLKH